MPHLGHSQQESFVTHAARQKGACATNKSLTSTHMSSAVSTRPLHGCLWLPAFKQVCLDVRTGTAYQSSDASLGGVPPCSWRCTTRELEAASSPTTDAVVGVAGVEAAPPASAVLTAGGVQPVLHPWHQSCSGTWRGSGLILGVPKAGGGVRLGHCNSSRSHRSGSTKINCVVAEEVGEPGVPTSVNVAMTSPPSTSRPARGAWVGVGRPVTDGDGVKAMTPAQAGGS